MATRCFFMRDGHFVGVASLPDAPRSELIRRAEALFKQRAEAEKLDGFELWAGGHVIGRGGTAATAPRNRNNGFVVFGLAVGVLQSAF